MPLSFVFLLVYLDIYQPRFLIQTMEILPKNQLEQDDDHIFLEYYEHNQKPLL